ncbi:MAG: ATP-binding protein [Caldilineaceae bacterium]
MQLGAIPPTEYTESYWADPRKVLTPAQVADAYHRYLEAGIQRSGYIIAVLYGIFAVLHWSFLPASISGTMTIAATASTLLLVGITYTARNVELSPFVTQVTASLMIWLVLGNSLLHLYLSREIWQTTNVIITVIAIGFFFLTPLLYFVHIGLALACWWLICLAIGSDSLNEGLWGHYQVALVTAIALSFIIQNILSHLVKRVAALRVRDDAQKQALQQALQSVQQSEVRLRRYAQQTEESLRQTQTLYHVSRSMTTAIGMNEILREVAECIAKELPAYQVTIYLFDMIKQQVVQTVSGQQANPAELILNFQQLMDGLIGWSVRKLKPAVSAKGIVDPREAPEIQRLRSQFGIGSVMVAPLLYREVPIGAIVAQNLFIEADFSDQNAETLMAIASQVGVAITNARLLDEMSHQAGEIRRLIEQAAAQIFAVDSQGRLIQWSSAMSRVTGIEVKDAVGKEFVELCVQPEERASVKKIFENALSGKSFISFECGVLDTAGQLHTLLLSCDAMHDAYGEIAYVVAIGQDITNRRQAEAQLQRINEELEQRVAERTNQLQTINHTLQHELAGRLRVEEELRRNEEDLGRRIEERTTALSVANAELSRAARLKDEFLANMSHELRTPLSAVLGLSEALQEEIYGKLNPQQHKTIDSVVESSRLLLALINDILDISKIEAGKFDLEYDWLDVGSVTRASLELIKQSAQKKNLQIEFTSDPQVYTIYADERRLKQILVNLLSNAVKFTPENGKIGLNVVGDVENQRVMFTVWDTGIGISEQNMAQLFQPFVQLDSSLARQHSGTGLGLALVYRMTRMHGGSITVESREGVGSQFTVALPWNSEISADVDQPLRPTDEFNGVSKKQMSPAQRKNELILIADDNETTLEAFSDYLLTSGFRIVTARNGKEAVTTAFTSKPSAILMDINMPEMDGIEAIRQLRHSDQTIQTPIIAITAMAMPGDKERCLGAGANEYLSKPVSLRMVLQTIEQSIHPEVAG